MVNNFHGNWLKLHHITHTHTHTPHKRTHTHTKPGKNSSNEEFVVEYIQTLVILKVLRFIKYMLLFVKILKFGKVIVFTNLQPVS